MRGKLQAVVMFDAQDIFYVLGSLLESDRYAESKTDFDTLVIKINAARQRKQTESSPTG